MYSYKNHRVSHKLRRSKYKVSVMRNLTNKSKNQYIKTQITHQLHTCK